MPYAYFSRNGEIMPAETAVVPLSNVAYAYGYGVYETIRAAKGTIYFLEEHCQRLLKSAEIIALPHNFSADFISRSVSELLVANNTESCNLKVILIGGPTADSATLYILCLNPLFPDRKLYKDGTTAMTYQYEREFPQAKTLNMLPSYLAFRDARAAGAYDALLIDRAGNITEGTRTNFFALQGRRLISPPEANILPGVTRNHVLQVAQNIGFTLYEQPVPLTELEQFDGYFLTSTSSKIMPLKAVDDLQIGPPGQNLLELMQAFDQLLSS